VKDPNTNNTQPSTVILSEAKDPRLLVFPSSEQNGQPGCQIWDTKQKSRRVQSLDLETWESTNFNIEISFNPAQPSICETPQPGPSRER
jgi:hypothetical protein